MRAEQFGLGLCFFGLILAFIAGFYGHSLDIRSLFTILVSPLMSVAHRNTSV